MYQYLPIENEVFSPSIGQYRTFGLRVVQSGETGERELMILPALSTDYGFILRLAGIFTRKQLDLPGLPDIIESLL